MVLRSTSVIVALGRRPASGPQRVYASLALPTSRAQFTLHHSFHYAPTVRHKSARTYSTDRTEQSKADASFDLKQEIEIEGVGVEAARDGGRNALNILESLNDVDANILILKSIQCLSAYREAISILTVEDAKRVLVADDAGRRVHDWMRGPVVWGQIEGNHPENHILLELLTAILFGTDRIQVLDDLLRYVPSGCDPPGVNESNEGLSSQRFRNLPQFRWRGLLFASAIRALAWWHPHGYADAAYDYFSDIAEEERKVYQLKIPHPFNNLQFYQAMVAVSRLMCKNHPTASARSFDRCLRSLLYILPPHLQQLHKATLVLHHPTRPTPDFVLAWYRDIESNRDHFSRIWQSKECEKLARFYGAVAAHAASLLRDQNRHNDARWVYEISVAVWGEGSRFWTQKSRSETGRPF
ncbi:hypothetical protein F4778DRAFT_447967 [Xylariomycetidae sp. FL2044]|nr:hypothetical protein F4778DRAFT_447967 [Xylariomycetidae sp. FL2044]